MIVVFMSSNQPVFTYNGNAFEDNIAQTCCKYGGDKRNGVTHRINGLCADYEPLKDYDWGICVSCKNLNGMKFDECLRIMCCDFGDKKARRFFSTFVKVSKRERILSRKPFNRFAEIDLVSVTE